MTTHSFRHLCLTDLARAGCDINEIARFAGHRSTQTTLTYIHLSVRDLAERFARSSASLHSQRMTMVAPSPNMEGAGDPLPVCFLDVPVGKTHTAFTKPVDGVVGDAIRHWERLRPAQPPWIDPKAAEPVHCLFAFRGHVIGGTYLNKALIPMLCRKAGLPEHDARGKITSHRARSTIASQLYNAKEPMSPFPFDLQAWLGRRSLHSTQLRNTTPRSRRRSWSKSYSDAGFQRNVRTIEVLIDRDAIASGATATGEPYMYYDLGHGYCTNSYFAQCVHRMACARCVFYAPKASTHVQLLESKRNNERFAQTIPLTEEERSAIDGDAAALDRLIDGLADTPTRPGGHQASSR